MRISKKYLKRGLAALLAMSMVVGQGTINWANTETPSTEKKDLVVYFANWSIYSNEKATVGNLPWEKITYVNHAFWEIEPVEGQENQYIIQSTDAWADTDTTNVNAHFTAYETYSEQYPDVNIMLSIGGWTRCGYFSEMASTEEGRASFIDSCIETMDTYTFLDGIDVDWEYPGTAREPENTADEGCPVVGDDFTNYTLLLKEMREAFDAKYGVGGKKITTCSSVNVNTIANQDVAEFAQYVDLINIMSYDMTGAYDDITGHHSALNPTAQHEHSVVTGVEYFLDKGVDPSKLNIGTPLYSHGWAEVVADENDNLIGVAASGEGAPSDKVWNVLKAMELLAEEDGSGWHKGYDEVAEAAYLYNDNVNSVYYQNFLSYEDERSLQAKLDYIEDIGLAGMIVWEVSGDSIADGYPMITQMAKALGIYDGEQTVYGTAGEIPDIGDSVSGSGYPDPLCEVVAGDGSTYYPNGTYIYYNGAVYKSINDNSSDWPANLPDGEWGASCWTKEFDVKQYVSQEDNGGLWAWAALAGEYVFYDPDKDGEGAIYLATADTSNTANDAPDGIWGTNWKYITGLLVGDAATASGYPDPMYEVVVGTGENVYPMGTYIYYKNAVWKSINNNSNDFVDNLPDGAWASSCWTKEFDVKQYVSQEELGYWDWAALAGEYVLYDPDKDGVAEIYYATADTSNTANDAPDGIWGTNWEYITTVVLAEQDETEEPSTEEVTTPETTTKIQETTKAPETTVAPTTKAEETTIDPATMKKPGKVKVKKVFAKKKASKKVKVKFAKVKGATGYEVQISNSKKFKKVLAKKTVKKAKITIKNKKLVNKKKLFVRVRAFVKVGDVKVAGKWSRVKAVKIK